MDATADPVRVRALIGRHMTRSGRARTDGLITHRFSLDDYGKALDAVAHDRSAHKVVIVP